MLQQNGDAAGRKHEQSQACSFHQIFGPVAGGGRDRARKPGSVCAARRGPGFQLPASSVFGFRLHSHIGFADKALVTNEREIRERRRSLAPCHLFREAESDGVEKADRDVRGPGLGELWRLVA